MAITIVTRAGKGSPLNVTEFDANFTNLAAAIENVTTGHDHDGTDSKVIGALGTPTSGTLTNCTGYAVAASESVIGVTELATNAEALTGSDMTRIVMPDDLKYVLDRRIQQFYGVTWDKSADTYTRTGATVGQLYRGPIQESMKHKLFL